MKALVTGSNGFIGSFLVEFLLGQGYSVTCLVRTTSNLQWLESLDVQFVYGDCRDKESLYEAVRDMDYVFHLAGKIRGIEWETYYRTNYLGTKNLIEVCEEINPELKRIVHLSSIAATGPSVSAGIRDEVDLCNPVNDYGKTKLLGEEAVRNLTKNIPYVIIRAPNVYGPREKELYSILKIIQSHFKPILGNGEKQTTICFVDDLVRGIFLAATSSESAGKIYYITDSTIHSYRDLMDIIARELGVSNLIIPLPYIALVPVVYIMQVVSHLKRAESFLTVKRLRHIRHSYMLFSGEKAEQELGFQPSYSFADGIRRTIDWYRDREMLK